MIIMKYTEINVTFNMFCAIFAVVGLHHLLIAFFTSLCYRNDPKFLNRQFLSNCSDPDQTAPLGAV